MVDRSASVELTRPVSRRSLSKQAVRLSLYAQLMMLDCIAVAVGFVGSGQIAGHSWVSPAGHNLGFLIVPTYLFFAANQHAYSIAALHSLSISIRRALLAIAITAILVIMMVLFMSTVPLVSRATMVLGMSASAILLVATRIGFHHFAVRQHLGSLIDELIISDGASVSADRKVTVLDAQAAQIEPDLQDPVMINRLASYLQGADRVIVACPPERQKAWSLLLKGSNIRGEILLPEVSAVDAIGLERFGDSETLVVSRGPLSLRSRAQKRALDLAITVPALILLSPLLVMVAVAIKLESPGPVFFKQSRIGRSNSVFDIMKFRSMRTELCDANGNRSASRDDDRITKVGAFIRRTSIDELPQLINVLRGDMSLVGPRPHALGSLAGDKLFWEVDEQYWVRHALKPGITGLAQVRGYRGATLQREDLENRLRSDLEYVNGWSLWLDVTILFATAKVIKHTNAF